MNIWTNGCFDILHVGHIRLLKFAKSLGYNLYVGIDSDARVKELKGKNRPINHQEARKECLEAIKYVEEVFIFSSRDHMCHIVKGLFIDTIVVGEEYRGGFVTASDIVKKVVYFPKVKGFSSTEILNKK